MSIRQRKSHHRQRFFSCMDYDEYVSLFGPPKPLLKPSADPELLDNFELNPESKVEQSSTPVSLLWHHLPAIRETKIQDEMSNNQTQRHESPHLQFEDDIRPPKRTHSRMRSQSQNHAYLIFNFLDHPEAMQRKKIKLS